MFDASENIDSLPVLLKTIKILFYIFINLTVKSAYESPVKQVHCSLVTAGRGPCLPAAVQPQGINSGEGSIAHSAEPLGALGGWARTRNRTGKPHRRCQLHMNVERGRGLSLRWLWPGVPTHLGMGRNQCPQQMKPTPQEAQQLNQVLVKNRVGKVTQPVLGLHGSLLL